MSSGGQIKTAQSNALSSRLESSNENLLASLQKHYIRERNGSQAQFSGLGTAEFCNESWPGCRGLIWATVEC
jgi:hypothetical protein